MQVKVTVGSKSMSMVLVHGHEDVFCLLVEMVGYSKALQLMDGPQQQTASDVVVLLLLEYQQHTPDAVLQACLGRRLHLAANNICIASSHLHACIKY